MLKVSVCTSESQIGLNYTLMTQKMALRASKAQYINPNQQKKKVKL